MLTQQMLVTDGKMQSAQFDEFAYHESLVHPALLKVASSLNGTVPKTVFIGGGGELATAREALRHTSVERVVMVDVDAKVVEVCTKYLPEWGGEAVLNDPRFELVIGDAHAYLMETQETFDAIIMDISDPIEGGPGMMLYTKELYEHALTRLNQPHGVFVTQAGTADSIPATDAFEIDPACFSPIYNTLKSAFDCVVPYSANIPSFGSDWGFVMAFQNPGRNGSNAGAVGLEEDWKVPPKGSMDGLIEKQIIGGPDALSFYDGITHLSMFALSKPLRKYMKKEDRIMTRENPIFMY
jgi:thermospermine synthase